jgi:SAM-dependent methyltransferase
MTMGCPLPVLHFLAREHKRKPFSGPVLTLGRQCVYATFAEVVAMLRAEGLTPHALPAGMSERSNLPGWNDRHEASYASDHAFFHALGALETQALDSSDYEQAEVIWDLNRPVPPELHGRFGMIFDGGTLEHVFDTRVALENIARMLKPGGRAIHTNPASNYLAHGFYQFGPALYHDYYGVNGFTDLRCLVVEQPTWSQTGHDWSSWEWDPRRPYSHMCADRPLMLFFSTEKTPTSTADRIPQQGDFSGGSDGGKTDYAAGSDAGGWRARLVRRLPPRLHRAIRRARGRDLSSKPWGLRYRGKL